MPTKLWRHGDVLIQAVPELPPDRTPKNDSVLAYGEATGHSHRIETPENADLWWAHGQLYMRVLAPTRIVHDEHKPIPLEPGTYRIWQQREYVPESQRHFNYGVSFRTVRD